MFVQNVPVLGKWLEQSVIFQIVVFSGKFNYKVTDDVKSSRSFRNRSIPSNLRKKPTNLHD